MKKHKTVPYFWLLLLLSCNSLSEEPVTSPWNYYCDHFYGKGEIKYDHYTFCSIVPVKVQYQYETGPWVIWDLKGHKIAEGRFHPVEKQVEMGGGCPVLLMKQDINKEEWIFWDDSGKVVNPSDSLVSLLEQTKLWIYK